MNMKQEILNPKTDWVFKLMFSKGEQGNLYAPPVCPPLGTGRTARIRSQP